MSRKPATTARKVPSWQIAVLRLAPAGASSLVIAGAYVLTGAMPALVAAVASVATWASFALAARKLDAIRDLRRRHRTNLFMQESINAIPMPIFVKDRHMRLIMVNDAYCEQRFLSRENIIGKTASELTSDPQLAQLMVDEDQLVLNGGRIRKEERIPHPVTRRDVYQVVTKALGHSESDRPLVIGTFFDMTSVRVAEQGMQDALAAQTRLREFLQFVLDALPTPMFVKDAQHRYIMVNRAHAESTGLPTQELLGKRVGDIIDPTLATIFEAHEDEMLQGAEGKVYESEHTVPSQNKGVRYEILRKVVGRDADGQLVIIGTATNITSLRHAEARWQFALEGAGDGLWDWDLVAGKTFYSPRWKSMQGFDDEEIGDSENERMRRIHPDDLEAAQAALDVHLSGRVPIYICELRQMNKHGEYIWMMDRGQVVERAPSGKPLRMIGIYTDITHHKHAEEELRRHRDSLRVMVEEQTIDLIHAKDEAERANAAKSQFLANMSHELRTPMHAVLSFAKLGEEKATQALQATQVTPDKLPVYFQRIRESGDRLLALLNDLLDLSKLEAGRMVLHIQRIRLESIVMEALGEFEASLLAKQLKAVVINQEIDTQVMADSTRLAQVVRNLLSNAIKFSPEGGSISLAFGAISTVATGAESPNTITGRMLELIVSDQGPGIPENELEAIFDKFVQSSTTRSSAGGTGLGLPICREIIAAHHGEIFARHAEQGAEFVVRIPKYLTATTLTT